MALTDNKFPLFAPRYRAIPRQSFILLILFVLASFRSLGTPVANELIGNVEKRYNGARTLSVNFVETYEVAGHPRPPESGTLTIKKQGKMRWDYSNPQGKLFISDGKNIFLYTARDNKVEKVPLKSTEDMRAPLAFLLGHLDLKRDFQDFHIREGDGGTWLEASAKSERVPYSRVQMLIGEAGQIRQLNVFGRDESVVQYSFSNEKLNPVVPDRLFRFTIPQGAEVVDSVEMAGQEK
jgi:outer membrane lipoprotein carrier protein